MKRLQKILHAFLNPKQNAIAFANWLHLNYQPHADEGSWYDHHAHENGDDPNETPIKTEELYRLYSSLRAKRAIS